MFTNNWGATSTDKKNHVKILTQNYLILHPSTKKNIDPILFLIAMARTKVTSRRHVDSQRKRFVVPTHAPVKGGIDWEKEAARERARLREERLRISGEEFKAEINRIAAKPFVIGGTRDWTAYLNERSPSPPPRLDSNDGDGGQGCDLATPEKCSRGIPGPKGVVQKSHTPLHPICE